MSAIDDIRALIADHPQFDRVNGAGDGSSVDFELPKAPAVVGTVVVRVDNVVKATPGDYAVDEALGLVTFVSAPALGASVTITYQCVMLNDDDLTTMLTVTGNDTLLAAAMALDTIASNEVMIQKRITVLGLSTDGPAEARALRDHANKLREVASSSEGAGFEIAEMVYSPFGWRERMLKELERGNA